MYGVGRNKIGTTQWRRPDIEKWYPRLATWNYEVVMSLNKKEKYISTLIFLHTGVGPILIEQSFIT